MEYGYTYDRMADSSLDRESLSPEFHQSISVFLAEGIRGISLGFDLSNYFGLKCQLIRWLRWDASDVNHQHKSNQNTRKLHPPCSLSFRSLKFRKDRLRHRSKPNCTTPIIICQVEEKIFIVAGLVVVLEVPVVLLVLNGLVV